MYTRKNDVANLVIYISVIMMGIHEGISLFQQGQPEAGMGGRGEQEV